MEIVRLKCLLSLLEGKSSDSGLPIAFAVQLSSILWLAFKVNFHIVILLTKDSKASESRKQLKLGMVGK